MIVILQHEDEQYAPPSQPVLRVEVVGSNVFLSIHNWEEGDHSTILPEIAITAVPIAALRGAIDLLEAVDLNKEGRNCSRSS